MLNISAWKITADWKNHFKYTSWKYDFIQKVKSWRMLRSIIFHIVTSSYFRMFSKFSTCWVNRNPFRRRELCIRKFYSKHRPTNWPDDLLFGHSTFPLLLHTFCMKDVRTRTRMEPLEVHVKIHSKVVFATRERVFPKAGHPLDRNLSMTWNRKRSDEIKKQKSSQQLGKNFQFIGWHFWGN